MKMIDKLAYVADELRYNYILNRTVIDAGKDLAKGAVIGAGIGLAINYVGLRKNGLPKSMNKYIIK